MISAHGSMQVSTSGARLKVPSIETTFRHPNLKTLLRINLITLIPDFFSSFPSR